MRYLFTKRRLLFILFLGSLLLIFAGWHGTRQAWGLQNPTIPTRTPVPQPTEPKPTKPPGNGGGSDATAVPTSTLPPAATATSTVVVTIAYTPVGGFVPTAEPCSSQPTILVRNPTNVREGPGTDYDIVSKLVYLEVRLILGRAANTPWWLIQLDDGAMGWVADDVVTVQGYIGNVPVIAAPEIDGQTPTPGTPWNPTPYPYCTVTPTFTPEPTATLAPVTPETAAAQTEPTVEATAVPPTETATATPEPTQTAVAPPTLPPTAATTPADEPETISGPATTTVPAAIETTRSSTDLLLPAAGLMLIAGAVVSFIARRKK